MQAQMRLPEFFHFRAPSHWQAIDFLSDLHLQASTPKTCDALFAHLRNTSADAVFILGDFFEVWVGDDCREDGFERELHDQLRAAAQGKYLAFMAGNRDFLVGQRMLESTGIQSLPDPTVLHALGQRVLLTHGDALCLADTTYQKFRSQVRSPAWQTQFLALPLAVRRQHARQMRDASEQRRQQGSIADYGDIDAPTAIAWLQAAETTTLLHGHTHRPSCEPLDATHTRWVTSDWDYEGVNTRGDVLRLNASGLQRVSPSLGT